MKLVFLLLVIFCAGAFAKTAAEWRSRNVYQILTDRFARTNGDSSPCGDFSNYCGGTFQGIINNLDYIQDLGFDAIWISPVILNNPGGYHGYWAKNIYEISPEFGGPDGLKALINACHARNIWVMVDIVANHMGPLTNGGWAEKIPFNDAKYYHNNVDCDRIDPTKQDQLETCWLAQLPDLDQSNQFVRDTLLKWVKDLVATYNIDGLRIDTVPYVPKNYWSEFKKAAGVYTVGEVFNGYMPYVAGYEGPIDSLLNYPLFFTLRAVFQQKGSMNAIQSYFAAANNNWKDQTILGNFVDNHDNARFLYGNGDHVAFKAALAFVLGTVGIPMTYYGSEQAYGGGNDPKNREPLWTNMQRGTEIYSFIKTINTFRKKAQIWNQPQVQRYSDDNFYAFTRGEYFFAFTNVQANQRRDITYHSYSEGTVLCDLFYESDCITVKNKTFPVYLNGGEVKIFVPKSKLALFKEENQNPFEKLEKKIIDQINKLNKEIRTDIERSVQEDPFTKLEKRIEKQIHRLEKKVGLDIQ